MYSIGTTPIKSFRNAVLAGDEDKALEIYTSEKNGNSLQLDMHPSLPFSSRKSNDETPLHLVAIMALNRLYDILINKGGCPNTPNKKDQTCLHSVCSRSDNSDLRYELLERIINWRPQAVADMSQISTKSNNKYIPGTEIVSVNHVDIDGNSAIHYAAYNGLLKCVRKLISLGAIISIVNKLQMTCCEMADEGKYKDLANMLELALVFQPEDTNMIQYNESNVLSHEGRPCILMLDTDVMQSEELNKYIDNIINQVCDSINTASTSGKHPSISRSHTEVLLNVYSWDGLKVIDEYTNNYSTTVKAAHLTPLLKFSTENISLDGIKDDDINLGTTLMPPEPPINSNTQFDDGMLPPPAPTHVTKVKSSVIATEAIIDEFCTICGDCMKPTITDSNDDIKLSISCQAGHSFCVECWSTNCSLQIKQEGVYCLKCPGFKCGEIITDEDLISKILPDPSIRHKLNEQRAAHVVDCKASLRWCPAKNCDCILNIKDYDPRYANALKLAHSKESGGSSKKQEREVAMNISILCLSQSVVCNRGHAVCLTCNSEAHSPCPCSDWQRWLQRVNEESKIIGASGNGDDIATALWVTANTKKCPRCTTPIEKDEGCNHMNCRKCRYEFCWICMQDWTLHSNATGGFFQCNRFVSNNNNNGDNNDANDESLARMLATEMGGSAQMETLRMRNRGQKMARFIHHFTRFKAHGESVLMEAKMYQETVLRISSELQDAISEHSNWLQDELVPIPDAKCGNSLEFLHLGFIELIKCRNILKGSFAFAFYAFEKESETSDDVMDPHMFLFEQLGISEFVTNRKYATPKGKSQKDATAVNPYTHTLLRRKRTFEFLQSDLEMLTEMLSDVVARRRLRASKNQIMEASRAAKNKRLEFEDMILSCITNDNENNTTPTSSERASRRGIHNRLHANESQNTRSLAWQSLYGNDLNDDNLDIAALISELEAPGRPLRRVASTDIDNESEGTNQLGINADASALASQTRSLIQALEQNLENVSVTSTSPRNRIRDNDNAATVRIVDSPRVRAIRDYRASRGQTVRTPNTRNSERPNQTNNSRSSDVASSSPNSPSGIRPTDWRQILLDSSQDEENLSAYTVSNIVSRAAEEEALNRAILLSLQAPSPANVASDFVASEVAVDALLSMGFERDKILIALRDSNNDVESAANRLLA